MTAQIIPFPKPSPQKEDSLVSEIIAVAKLASPLSYEVFNKLAQEYLRNNSASMYLTQT